MGDSLAADDSHAKKHSKYSLFIDQETMRFKDGEKAKGFFDGWSQTVSYHAF